jgi:uncharacterized membrane protein YbhN (UPF0104 family)
MAVDTELAGGAQVTGPPRRGAAEWRSLFFAPVGDGRRRRRGSDGLRVAVATIAVLCAILVLQVYSNTEHTLAHVLYPPPSGIQWAVTVIWWVGTLGVVLVLVALSLLARRWSVLRDLGVAAGGVLLCCGVSIALLGSDGGRKSSADLTGFNLNFPVVRLALVVGMIAVSLPYLARTVQRLVELLLAVTALATVVIGQGLPVNVLASLALGWGVAAAVHLGFGSPLGLPSGEEVGLLLGDIDLHPTAVVPSAHQVWGVGRFVASMPDGDALHLAFYGRDASDAQMLAKTGRFIFYRDSGPTLAFTRLQQVEHEAYLTLLAGRAGARVSEVVNAASVGPSHDAVLVTRHPSGQRLEDLDPGLLTDAALDGLFAEMLVLRRARIAHGAVSPESVVVDPDSDQVGLVEFRNAVSSANAYSLNRDLAGAMAAATVVAGPERTVASVLRVVAPGDLAGALGHLRRASLDPVAARALRSRQGDLDKVRTGVAEGSGIPVPELVEPRRISWGTFILAAGTLIGGWALLLVLINVSHSMSTIIGAKWGWVIATFILCQLAYAGAAYSTLGSVTGILPYGRLIALEVANSFSSLAGGTPATFATRVRFFQQEGYPATVAVSSGALVSSASWLVKGVLFVIALPLAWSQFHFHETTSSNGHGDVVWLILAVVLVIGVGLGLILLVPRLRRLAADKLRPKLHDVLGTFKELMTRPRKMAQLLGGSAAAQLLVAMALGTALHAFGDHLSIAALLIVITLASMLGGVSPVPGGMGVVEAGMILGLTAAGISQTDATAAVFVQRLFSSYLPPIWGWFTLMWMRRREYL